MQPSTPTWAVRLLAYCPARGRGGGAACAGYRESVSPPEILPRIFDLFTQAERSLDRRKAGWDRTGSRAAPRGNAWGNGGGFECFGERQRVRRASASGLGSRAGGIASYRNGPSNRLLDPVDGRCRCGHRPTLALLVKESGHEVRTAYDGPAVLEAALDHRPNVVLLDIGLPVPMVSRSRSGESSPLPQSCEIRVFGDNNPTNAAPTAIWTGLDAGRDLRAASQGNGPKGVIPPWRATHAHGNVRLKCFEPSTRPGCKMICSPPSMIVCLRSEFGQTAVQDELGEPQLEGVSAEDGQLAKTGG